MADESLEMSRRARRADVVKTERECDGRHERRGMMYVCEEGGGRKDKEGERPVRRPALLGGGSGVELEAQKEGDKKKRREPHDT